MSKQDPSAIRPVRLMILAAITIALLAVAGIGIFAAKQSQEFGDSLMQVSRPKQYLNEVISLVGELLEAENSLRIYALTGDKGELTKLKAQIEAKSYEKRMQRLREFAYENKNLLTTTDSLEAALQAKYEMMDRLSKGDYVLTEKMFWNALVARADTIAERDSISDDQAPFANSQDESKFNLMVLKLGLSKKDVSPLANWTTEMWIENMSIISSQGYLSGQRNRALETLIEQDKALTKRFLEQARRFQGDVRLEPLDSEGTQPGVMETYRDYFGLFALLVVVLCLLLLWNIFRNLDRNRQLQEQLEEEKARAEKLAAAKEEFLANMSHEIRTPMNAVIGFAEQLARTRLNAKQQNMLNPIRQSANYLLALINDVLDYSKMDAGAFRLEETNFKVSSVIQEVITTFSHTAQKKKILLQYIPDGDLPEVLLGDPLRLRQMLFNLVGNAVKFTEKGSVKLLTSVVIEEKSKSCTMIIKVKDTGIGIPADRLDSVFSDFEQADSSTTRKYGGTGLGLPITKRLAEVHGGKIEIDSKPGKGTEVTVHLPYAIGTGRIEEPVVETGVLNHRSLEGLHILLADDELYNRELIKVIMEKWAVDLDAVNNGKQVIDRLKSGKKYDLILMDLQMPEMDGMESSRYIRKELKLEIPILAMTATSTEKEIKAAREAGMNAHLLKPFQEVELLSLLSQWLKIPETVETESYKQEKNTSSDPESSTTSYQLKTLFDLSNQDEKMVVKMLTLFQNRSQSHILALKEAINHKEYGSIGAKAHQMIPSCRHLGLDFLVSKLSELESMVKETEMDEQAIAETVELVESEIKLVTAQIEKDIARLS